ncbi:MAG TPA: hypothetical protein VK548_22930 [Candidatus Acidoferrum sp.]|nr:hypothetical protein [Candidatus Acidoferrum sp.]
MAKTECWTGDCCVFHEIAALAASGAGGDHAVVHQRRATPVPDGAPQDREELDETKAISHETFEQLHEAEGLFPSGLFWCASGLRHMNGADRADPKARDGAVMEVRRLLELLKAEIEVRRRTAATEVGPSRAPSAADVAPLLAAEGSYGRYEVMYTRELDRAMDRLMRLQQRRKMAQASAPDFAKQTHHAG